MEETRGGRFWYCPRCHRSLPVSGISIALTEVTHESRIPKLKPRASRATLTPEERSEAARKGGMARWAKTKNRKNGTGGAGPNEPKE
jgi:hypothetical protein